MDGVSIGRRLAAWATLTVSIVAALVGIRFAVRNLGEILLLLVGLGLIAAAAWWFMTEAGVLRIAALALAAIGITLVITAVAVSVSSANRVVLWSVILVAAMVLPSVLARYALTRPAHDVAVAAEHRPQHPVLLCNPWSGGGKVERFGLIQLAEEMGVETVMLDRGLDLEELTRDAVARGADCLGMAGGDGSQALVASVAIEHGLPYVCIPAGTRNHLALDLGLDRDDPRGAMQAFRDGVERRIDIGRVNGRLFVNNVSLGIYATIVQSPDYRDAKVDVSRTMIRKLLARQAEPFDLQYTTPDGTEVDGAFVIMVSNNRYTLGARRDNAQRREMDSGQLGVFAVSARTAAQAGRLISLAAMGMRDISKHWYEFVADRFEVRSRSGTIYAGIDGEALELESPLLFESHPAALRMLVPRGNLTVVERRRARNLSLRRVVSVAMGREPDRGHRA